MEKEIIKKKNLFFKTSDDAFLYYQDMGEGNPIILLHGWSCSSEFWRKNVNELSKKFRIITVDFRGHGSSSKVLYGHTIPRYAQDVMELITFLDLNNVVLTGWSMAVTTVLSFYEQYSKDGKLKAIGIIDGTPAPFLDEEWNYHRMKKDGGDVDKMNEEIINYVDNPKFFASNKAMGWLKAGNFNKNDIKWITNEILKTPPWISYSVFTDFLHRDYTHVLKEVEVPVIVYCSKKLPDRYATGKYIADNVSKGTLVAIDSGHLPFYERSEEFNSTLISFINGI